MHAIHRSCNTFKRLCRNVARISELLAKNAPPERFQLGLPSDNRHGNTSKLERTDLEHAASLEKDHFPSQVLIGQSRAQVDGYVLTGALDPVYDGSASLRGEALSQE